jgi:hypothetical protein
MAGARDFVPYLSYQEKSTASRELLRLAAELSAMSAVVTQFKV